MTMRELTYQVSFNTPAFLGNAEQQAQWRTPPFKALLRQWWRVVKAPDVGYDHHKLLQLENALFGSAADDAGDGRSGRSKVQLRLSDWACGTLHSVAKGEMVKHDEVPSKQVGANLYLGYGPIGGAVPRSAIDPKASPLTLKLRFPADFEQEIRNAMQLAQWFGTVGSRSRNGFGAVHFEGDGLLPAKDLKADALTAQGVLLATRNCLQRDWPHAIGMDQTSTPTIWRLLKPEGNKLDGFSRWEDVMLMLAQIKIAVRTAEFFKFQGGGPAGHDKPQPRHLLSYPSGNNHSVNGWGKDGRMANQMRFKVHRRLDGKFMAVIVHLPCALPDKMLHAVKSTVPDQEKVWAEVHRLLDAQKRNGLIRLAGSQ
jgi:CRISPR-associated protein Cmr1